MPDQPPPFSALRAVEAASRHRSYTWAAKELRVTHSAISQSIKRLESELGATLFVRKGGAMEPSEAAIRLAKTYADAAEALSQTIREVAQLNHADVLGVSMPQDFGRLWFAGRLGRLAEAMPDIRVQALTKAEAHGALAIRIGDPATGGAPVTDIQAFPVCSPAFQATHKLDQARDLAAAPLLAMAPLAWSAWAERRGVPSAAFVRVHGFDDAAMALDAAAQGAGVLLTHLFVAEAYLESGKLVALPLAAPSGLGLNVLVGTGVRDDIAERFQLWLRLEVSRSLAMHEGRMRAG